MATYRNPRQWALEQADANARKVNRTRQFLAVFFGRASAVIRARYGPTAYIDATGPAIVIADSTGLLGAGLTLKAAMAAADTRKQHRKLDL